MLNAALLFFAPASPFSLTSTLIDMPVHPGSPPASAPHSLRAPVNSCAAPDSKSVLAAVLVIIPVRNEAATIGDVVRGCRELGAAVWVVDNGSTDSTGHCAASAGARVL